MTKWPYKIINVTLQSGSIIDCTVDNFMRTSNLLIHFKIDKIGFAAGLFVSTCYILHRMTKSFLSFFCRARIYKNCDPIFVYLSFVSGFCEILFSAAHATSEKTKLYKCVYTLVIETVTTTYSATEEII